MQCVASSSSRYVGVKRQFRRDTARVGLALTTAYTVFDSGTAGASVALGAVTSCAYVECLCRYVDALDKYENGPPFQSHVLLPAALFGFETACIRGGAFDFDYAASVVGFMSYQCALMGFLYTEIRNMLIPPRQPPS